MPYINLLHFYDVFTSHIFLCNGHILLILKRDVLSELVSTVHKKNLIGFFYIRATATIHKSNLGNNTVSLLCNVNWIMVGDETLWITFEGSQSVTCFHKIQCMDKYYSQLWHHQENSGHITSDSPDNALTDRNLKNFVYSIL